MKAGQLDQACEAFEASNRLEARAGTLIRLGECREQNHQLASAWSAYKDALTRVKDPRKKAFATAKVVELEPKLSYLTITIGDDARIVGLVLTRNGQPLDPALWNRGVPINGGDYVIVGRAPGHEDWQTTATVPAESGKITVEVPRLKEIARPVATRPAAPPSSTTSSRGASPAGSGGAPTAGSGNTSTARSGSSPAGSGNAPSSGSTPAAGSSSSPAGSGSTTRADADRARSPRRPAAPTSSITTRPPASDAAPHPADGTAPPTKPATSPAAPREAVERDEAPASLWTGRRKIAIGVAAGGAAAVVAGIVLGGQASSKHDAAHQLCPSVQTPCKDAEQANQLVSEGKSRALDANIAFGVGAALAIGASVLWFTGSPEATARRIAILPSVAPGEAGLVVFGRL